MSAGLSQVAARSFFDPELGVRGLRKLDRRRRAGFDFVQEGTFQKLAETQRLKVRCPWAGMMTGAAW